jgi:peptide deformylase
MSVRPVLVYPNPMLRAKTVEVTAFDQSLYELAIDMAHTMDSLRALGLAAIQIGDIRRVIVLRGELANQQEPLFLVNPQLDLDGLTEKMPEGCLSFPKVTAQVVRHRACSVVAKTLEGTTVAYKADGAFAQALQHEVDHLDAVLLVDKVAVVKRGMIRKKFSESPRFANRIDHIVAAQEAQRRLQAEAQGGK